MDGFSFFFILTPEFCLLTSIFFTRYDSRDARYLLGLTEKGNSYTIELKIKKEKEKIEKDTLFCRKKIIF